MSSGMMIARTLSELAVVLVLIFGFLKENKLLRFQRTALRVMRVLRRKARDARKQEQQAERLQTQYADEYETDRSSKTAVVTGRKRKSSRGKVA